MARLILLNGPPGCGKSTLAQKFVADHPLALNLDIDHLRRQLGDWQARPQDSGTLARRIALAAAEVHLGSGHDVVVPQYLGEASFIEDLTRLAHRIGVPFHEFVLLASKETLLQRFAARTREGADPSHVEAQQMIDREGGEALTAMYDRLLALPRSRPAAVCLDVEDDHSSRGYQQLRVALARLES